MEEFGRGRNENEKRIIFGSAKKDNVKTSKLHIPGVMITPDRAEWIITLHVSHVYRYYRIVLAFGKNIKYQLNQSTFTITEHL